MYAGEHAEEISVERRGVWNPRIPEERGKHGGERNPENHGGGEARRSGAIELFNEGADDERRVLRLLPRQHAEDAGLHGKIQNRDADMEMKMPRGMLRAGSRISPPRWQ